MAERKRGLGRGLGALIPDVVTEDRPVDVFFGQQGEAESGVSHETSRSKDPAEGMREARAAKRRTAKPAKTTSSSPAGQRTRAPEDKKPQESASKTAARRDPRSASQLPVPETAPPGHHDVSRETGLQAVPGTAFGLVPLEQISPNPRQPRQVFDEDALDELVHSIREVGVLQPVVVLSLIHI